MDTLAAGSACANCGARLTGPYCAACGQKSRAANPTVHDFAHEIAEELLHFDGKIFRSIWLLFARPGFLTKEAFLGRRASYVTPFRLYLLVSVLFFAAFALAPTLFQLTYRPDSADTIDPAVLAERVAEVRAAANEAFNHWLPRLMFVLMPIFAALVMLVRPRRGLNYPQHLYFAMHVHAVGFFVATLVALANVVVVPFLSKGVTYAGLAFALGHSAVALHTAYGTGVWGTLWRTAVVSAAYWAIVVLGMAAVWLPAVLPLMKQQYGG